MDSDKKSVSNFEMDFNAFLGKDDDDIGFGRLSVVQESTPKKIWDKSPLPPDLPTLRTMQKPVLSQLQTLVSNFRGSPVNNPVNGNIIFCDEREGVFYLHEIDPRRGNVQVQGTPILTTEFQRKVTAKYNTSVYKVDALLALSAGLHHTNGQTRTRVAAIVDLAVLESKQVLRVVAVWQWGYGSTQPISLQYAITPPSGGDFYFDSSTLQNADGLVFLAGASPKGPCIFMCKPLVKETWSANFLGGSGRVTCTTVNPSLKRNNPYLAIALDDGSLNIWTYSSALASHASKENPASRRWLFPVCRMEHAAALAAVEPTPPSEKGPISDLGTCERPILHVAGLRSLYLLIVSSLSILCRFCKCRLLYAIRVATATTGFFIPAIAGSSISEWFGGLQR